MYRMLPRHLDQGRIRPAILLAMIGLATTPLMAAEADGDNQAASPPPCEYCSFPEGDSGYIEAGGILVSDDTSKFGEYNGLDEEGGYLLLEGYWQRVFEDGRRLKVGGADLGLETRSLFLDYGKQGSYKLSLGYDETPQRSYFGGQTVYREQNAYDNVLGLPAGWVDASSTGAMPMLDSSLRPLELETLRRESRLGFEYSRFRNWDFDVEFRHDEKDGQRLGSASFLTTTSQLPVPRDFTTDSIELNADYANDGLHLRFGYYLSFFKTTHDSLSWENPFTAITPGADQGRMALEPDNEFHQLSAALSYRLSPDSMFHLRTALGTGSQDDDFLPATANAMLATVTLPRNSLDGKVDTTNIHARLTSRYGNAFKLQLDLRSDERDNKTPRASYTQVVTDNYIAAPETNLAYDISRDRYTVAGSYRASSRLKMRIGIEQYDVERNHIERDSTSEFETWLDAHYRPADYAALRMKYSRSDRDGSRVIFDEPVTGAQNDLLKRFHIANRDREAWRLSLDLDPLDWMMLSFGTELRVDDYPASGIGLRQSQSRLHSIDASFVGGGGMRYALFAIYDEQRSKQAGSETFSSADWFATNRDETVSYGIAAIYEPPHSDWSWKADLSASEFEGETSVDTVTADTEFPDLVAQMYRAEFQLGYRISASSRLNLGYIYEMYDARDWQIDAAGVSSVPTLLAAGLESPNYRVSMIAAGYRWNFR